MTAQQLLELAITYGFPLLFLIRFVHRTTEQMRFLERQLEQLTEATARLAARTVAPENVQQLAANANPPSEPEPEPQPLPEARARYVK